MKTELVTVMMPAYNAERFVRQAIESVLSQTYPDWELIVVDDGSTDSTAAIVQAYTDPRIKYIHQKNAGEAAARNTVLKNMKGEYLAFLDADDLYLPNHLESLMNGLLSNEHLDAVYGDGYYIDQDENRLQTLSSRRRGPFEGDIFEQAMRSSDVFGGTICMVLRHRCIMQLKLEFDTEIVIGPDWDFLTQFSEVAKIGYVNALTCLYRIHQSNISFRTHTQQRTFSLAKCREKAIKLHRFNSCSEEVRADVFYDLLINLLPGFPERQAAIVEWPEFVKLPRMVQARLLRLMATTSLVYEKDHASAKVWLQRAFQLDPLDFRSAFLRAVYLIHPKLLTMLLKIKYRGKDNPRTIQPFADLQNNKSVSFIK